MTRRTGDDNTDLPHGIGNPARRALALAGYVRLHQLTRVNERELLKLHGVGPKAIRVLGAALAARGKAFAPPRAANRTAKATDARRQR